MVIYAEKNGIDYNMKWCEMKWWIKNGEFVKMETN